jgi:hypothetical protein
MPFAAPIHDIALGVGALLPTFSALTENGASTPEGKS